MIAALLAAALLQDAPKDRSGELQAQFTKLLKAIAEKDARGAIALTKGFRCDAARFKKALKEGIDDAAVDRFVALHKEYFDVKEEELAGLFNPGDPARTEVLVHAATTEELAKRDPGSKAWANFAGGTQKVAQDYLRPATMFYSLKVVKPGEPSGMTYHLFFFDGEGWAMIGKAWRLPPPK